MDAVPLPMLIGAVLFGVGTAVVLVWVLAGRRRIRRQREAPTGPATMELGTEPPPVVALLVNRLEVTADAVAAALLDLAADGFIEIVEVSPEHVRIRRLRHRTTPPRSGSDRQLLLRIDGAGGDLSLPELAESLRKTSFHDWSPFAETVRADAEARGLVQPAQDAGRSAPLFIGTIAACVGIVVAVPGLFILTPFVFLGGVLGAAIARGGGLVLTDDGRAAATHWHGVRRRLEEGAFADAAPAAVAVWDRYLAVAAALGISQTATRTLVAEVRTEVTTRDLVEVGGAVRALWRLLRRPTGWEDLHRQRHLDVFGPDVPPTQLFGPEPDDWWELLEVTGRAWPVAGLVVGRDRVAWADAAQARLERLVDGAPAELSGPIAVLAPSAATYVALIRGAVTEVPSPAPFSTEAEQRAIDELVAGIAAHRGLEATRHTVYADLTADAADAVGPAKRRP